MSTQKKSMDEWASVSLHKCGHALPCEPSLHSEFRPYAVMGHGNFLTALCWSHIFQLTNYFSNVSLDETREGMGHFFPGAEGRRVLHAAKGQDWAMLLNSNT